MTAQLKRAVSLLVILSLSPVFVSAAKLVCPESPEDSHRKEVVATSAPEVKVRSGLQGDSRRWAETVKPLTQKAIKAAKAQRAIAIQEGIDHGCASNQTFVGQYVPVPERPSGCEHKVVTRPADDGHIYVQVIAVCKYDWMCCSSEESKSVAGTGRSGSYTIEGPIGGTSTTTPNNAGSGVQSAPATSAPGKLAK